MVDFPTCIPDCDSHSPAVFSFFFFFFDAGVCSAVAFPPLSISQWDSLFHHIAYDYSNPDWDGLHNDLRDAPWEDIFKFGASAAASEFCEWVQVGNDVYIPHRKYQVKPHSSP